MCLQQENEEKDWWWSVFWVFVAYPKLHTEVWCKLVGFLPQYLVIKAVTFSYMFEVVGEFDNASLISQLNKL